MTDGTGTPSRLFVAPYQHNLTVPVVQTIYNALPKLRRLEGFHLPLAVLAGRKEFTTPILPYYGRVLPLSQAREFLGAYIVLTFMCQRFIITAEGFTDR